MFYAVAVHPLKLDSSQVVKLLVAKDAGLPRSNRKGFRTGCRLAVLPSMTRCARDIRLGLSTVKQSESECLLLESSESHCVDIAQITQIPTVSLLTSPQMSLKQMSRA